MCLWIIYENRIRFWVYMILHVNMYTSNTYIIYRFEILPFKFVNKLVRYQIIICNLLIL